MDIPLESLSAGDFGVRERIRGPDEQGRTTGAILKSAFLPRLVNGPFGDPGLHVALRWDGRAVQFDLGSLDRFPAASLLRISQIFISHTHLDHFIGFDRILRLFLARDAVLEIFGPPGITSNVMGKLGGYTWNLVEGYSFSLKVHELFEDRAETTLLRASSAFQAEPRGSWNHAGVIHEDTSFRVEHTRLDHRIPSLAYAIVEPTHINVRKDVLSRRGWIPGPWLNQLKQALRRGDDSGTRFSVPRSDRSEKLSLGDLAQELIVESPGQRIVYVVDTRFSRENMERIVELARGADMFFCESLFLDVDRHEATKRSHLTARQAGTLARMAGVKALRTFHFSPRYEGRQEELRREADAAFRGELPPDSPE